MTCWYVYTCAKCIFSFVLYRLLGFYYAISFHMSPQWLSWLKKNYWAIVLEAFGMRWQVVYILMRNVFSIFFCSVQIVLVLFCHPFPNCLLTIVLIEIIEELLRCNLERVTENVYNLTALVIESSFDSVFCLNMICEYCDEI